MKLAFSSSYNKHLFYRSKLSNDIYFGFCNRPKPEVPSSKFQKNILITAALPYINNVPHLGNIIGALLSADVYARFCRMRGYNTLFISGTDQYGTATQVKALQSKTSAKQLCDKFHNVHKQIYDWFEISTDFFGRTSSQKHKQIVQEIFTKIDKGHGITEHQMTSFYCNTCNMALADRFVHGTCTYCGFELARADQCDNCSKVFNIPTQQLKQPTCIVCQDTPIPKKCKHLFLDLKSLEKELREWLQSNNGMQHWTNNSKAITMAWLRDLKSRCITRDLKWGVPVPSYRKGFQDKVLYVWFDAPIGYISMTAELLGQEYKKWWFKQQTQVQLVQFMGKDNTVFHSVMFPGMLTATKQPYIKPKRLCVTEYLRYEKGKFSKSRGKGVFGDDCKQIGVDSSVWRFFLCANRPETYDTQFTWQDFAAKNNKQLLNSIGNLYQRVFKYANKHFKQQVQGIRAQLMSDLQISVLQKFQKKVNQFVQKMENVQIKQATNVVLETAYLLNKYLQDSQFWRYAKVEQSKGCTRRDTVIIRLILEILSAYSQLISPFMPKISKILSIAINSQAELNAIQNPKNLSQKILQNIQKKCILKQIQPLFSDVSDQKVSEWKQKYTNNIKQ